MKGWTRHGLRSDSLLPLMTRYILVDHVFYRMGHNKSAKPVQELDLRAMDMACAAVDSHLRVRFGDRPITDFSAPSPAALRYVSHREQRTRRMWFVTRC
jgi:hypothetical protein